MIVKKIFIYLFFFTISQLFGQSWQNNTIGIDDIVPKPWQPIDVKTIRKNLVEVNMWGRKYTIDNTSLLQQAYSAEEPLLAKPITFTIDNKNVKWHPNALKIVSQSKSKIVLEFSAYTIYNNSKINVNTTLDAYYDGVLYYSTAISADKPINKNVSIKIEINPNISKYLNRYANPTATNKTSWRTNKYDNDATGFIPYWWVGNNDKGLFWFAESPEGWDNYENEKTIRFSKTTDKKSIITINLAQLNTKLSKFEFGFQATPVKPTLHNWRDIVLVGSKDSNTNIIWPHANKPFALKYFGYPEAKILGEYKKHIEEITTPGKKTLAYNNITFISASAPEWKQFHNEWDTGGQDLSGDVKAYGSPYVRTNLDSKSYQDFIIWKSREFLRNTNLDGFYLDYSMIGNINQHREIKKNNYSPKKMPYFPIMKMRSLYERFYKMVKNDSPDNMIIAHASARLVPPVVAFSDAYVNGEQFNQSVAKVDDDYLKVTNLQAFQSEYNGKAYGIPGIFLPSFTEKNYSVYRPTRKLVALLLAHDISIWPIYSLGVVWDEMFEIYKSFPGFQHAEFIPYYSDNSFATSNSDSLLISAYKNENNDYLCIISNISATDVTADIQFNLNLSFYSIVRLSSRNNFSNDKNIKSLTVTIKDGDFIPLYITQKSNNDE